MMLHKPAFLLFGALTASLMLGACNQKPGAGTTPPDSAQQGEPAAVAVAEGSPAVASVHAIPADCRIQSATGWQATVQAQPPGKPRLEVTGEVETSTGGYEVALQRKGTDADPATVTLELIVTPPPADAMVSQMITPHAVKAEVPDVSRDLKLVVIDCGGAKLTEIAEIAVVE